MCDIYLILDLMEQAQLAGGAMTTHVVNAIYLGSLWILIKFLRWRSNHCRGGWIVPEWRRWYNTRVRHKEPDCTKGGWYDTSSKPHRRPLPRAIRFDRSDNNSHFNRRSNISSVLCKKYTRLSLTDVNSPYSRDLIRCPPPAVSTSCRRCCWGSCQPGRHQAWCCSCCSAPLLPASPPAPACSPADPKPRQKPGNCGIIENLRKIPWEGLSLLIRGTIGAISRSNSKVGGWQLNPGLMGGLSMLNPPTKLFADLAKHRPSWSPAINPI